MTTKCIHPRPFICVRDHRLALLASSRTDMDVTASRMENTLALFSRKCRDSSRSPTNGPAGLRCFPAVPEETRWLDRIGRTCQTQGAEKNLVSSLVCPTHCMD